MRLMRRGANVALTQEIPGLTGVVLGVRFDAGAERVVTDNLVVAAVLCKADNKVLTSEHFVFFNQLTSPDLSVTQLESALGEDTEQIEVDLLGVPADIAKIVLVAYLNDGLGPRRSLGRLRTCTVRVLDLRDNAELVRSENLAEQMDAECGVSLGELYRHQGGWKFRILGAGYARGISDIAADFGIHL